MMNSLEKYLFNSQEEYKEAAINRYQNDFTSVAGKVVRIGAIISIDDNIKTGFRYVKFLVIDLNDEVKVLTVKMKMGEEPDTGVIVKEAKLKKSSLRPIYTIFYLLNQIQSKKEKQNERVLV